MNRTHSSQAIVCYTKIPPARGIALKSYRICLLDGYLSASQIRSLTPMSALPPKSDRLLRCRQCPLCAISDQSAAQQNEPLFDHLVAKLQERLSRRQAERLGCLQIDSQFKSDGRLHWQISRFLTLENAIHVCTCPPADVAGRARSPPEFLRQQIVDKAKWSAVPAHSPT